MDMLGIVKFPAMVRLYLNASANTTRVETIVRNVVRYSISGRGDHLLVVWDQSVKVRFNHSIDFILNSMISFDLKNVSVLDTRMSAIMTKALPTKV